MCASSLSLQNATAPLYVGVDVGGTNIKLGVVDDAGRVLTKTQIPTQQERGPADAMRRITEQVGKLIAQLGLSMDDVRSIGLATPGTMDLTKGIILQPHNLPKWWNFPVRDCLQELSGRPVAFANDANAAAFGEFWVGRGADFHSIALFTLGTGVGGGIIIGNLSIAGEHSAGSELGHTIIDYHETARLCGCGQRGHLEAYASARALVQRTLEELANAPDSSLHERAAAGEELTPLIVAQEAERGDALARQIVLDTARYLGIGAVNIMHTVDPGAVIFGGAMNFGGHSSPLGEQFLERIRQEVHERAFPVLRDRTHIDFAMLGGDAGFIGAAAIARAAFGAATNA